MERNPRTPGVGWLAAVLLALLASLAAASGAGAAPPSNDRFTNASPLAGERGEVRASNVGATAEAGEPPHVRESATHSVWFRWTAPVTASFVIDTCGSRFDTLLAVYVGTTISSLNSVAESDDDCGDRSALTIAVAAGESYAIAVDGYEGETGVIVLRWSRLEAPSNDAFASAVTLEGTGGDREGTVSGATREPSEPSDVGRLQGSVWFVWSPPSDGLETVSVPTTGFDSSIAVYVGDSPGGLQLVRANEDRNLRTSAVAFPARRGTTYRIAVRGAAPVRGGEFTLRWARPQPPENDRPEQARFVSGEAGTATASTFAAGIDGPEQSAAALGEEAGSVWLAWRAPHDGPASVQVCGGSGPRGLAVLAGETSIPLGSRSGTCGRARVGFTAAAGMLYRLAVVGPRERSVSFTVSWGYPPANDELEHAQDLGNAAGGAVAGSTVGATIEDEERLPDDLDAIGSTWYAWRAPATGWTTFDTCGSAFDTVLAVYSGDALETLAQLAVDDDSCGSATSRVRIRAVQGAVYRIAVRDFEGDTGRFELHWRPSPPPANDAFSRATLLRGANGRTAGTTVGTSRQRGEPRHVRRTTGTAWYRWIAPATRWESFATCGSGFDTVVAVYRLLPLARLTQLDVSDDDCETGSVVRFAAERGVEYRIVVTGYGRQDEFLLAWRRIAPPLCVVPTVVGRPLSVAKASIEDAYCRVGTIRVVPLELVPHGTVVGQTPQDRRPVRRAHGTRVRLEVAGP